MGMYRREDTVEVDCFLQVEPEWRNQFGGEKYLADIAVERLTKRAPSRPVPGSVTVKVRLRFPAAVFYPLMPEAVIDVAPAAVRQNPIEVIAVEPPEEPEENA